MCVVCCVFAMYVCVYCNVSFVCISAVSMICEWRVCEVYMCMPCMLCMCVCALCVCCVYVLCGCVRKCDVYVSNKHTITSSSGTEVIVEVQEVAGRRSRGSPSRSVRPTGNISGSEGEAKRERKREKERERESKRKIREWMIRATPTQHTTHREAREREIAIEIAREI